MQAVRVKALWYFTYYSTPSHLRTRMILLQFASIPQAPTSVKIAHTHVAHSEERQEGVIAANPLKRRMDQSLMCTTIVNVFGKSTLYASYLVFIFLRR